MDSIWRASWLKRTFPGEKPQQCAQRGSRMLQTKAGQADEQEAMEHSAKGRALSKQKLSWSSRDSGL